MVFAFALAMTAPQVSLDVLNPEGLSSGEMVLATTLQGLANRGAPRVWIKWRNVQAIIEQDLRAEGAQLREVDDVWALLERHRSRVEGVVLYREGQPCLNVATSLSGPLNAVAVESAMEAEARRRGFRVLKDVRGMSEQEAWTRFGDLFRRGMVIEQVLEKAGYLRDYAVKHSAFVIDAHQDREFRRKVVGELARGRLAFGWSRDEFQWIEDLSRAGATGVPADWCRNLSALEELPVQVTPPARQPVRSMPNKRMVAFVLTDGDNIQWMTDGFVTDRAYYGSPRRGTFPMTWEVAPILARVAPRVLQIIYRTATPYDDFVTGPGLLGYTFPSLLPNRETHAVRTAPFLRESGLSVVSFLNINDGDPMHLAPWMNLPEVDAGLYKEFDPYHRPQGRVVWFGDKPLIGYRFVLWENLLGIDALVREISAMPTSGEGRFALINVHAWSYGSIGGPMEAVYRVIGQLPADTEVVTVHQLVHQLREDRRAMRGAATDAAVSSEAR